MINQKISLGLNGYCGGGPWSWWEFVIDYYEIGGLIYGIDIPFRFYPNRKTFFLKPPLVLYPVMHLYQINLR